MLDTRVGTCRRSRSYRGRDRAMAASFCKPFLRWLIGSMWFRTFVTRACSSAPAFSTSCGGVPRTVLNMVLRASFDMAQKMKSELMAMLIKNSRNAEGDDPGETPLYTRGTA